jgi:hypothetical protein
MPLREAYTAVRIAETNENYARADGPLVAEPETRGSSTYNQYYDGDEFFWRRILKGDHAEDLWGEEFEFHRVSLSEWVPRVPGLFWTQEARNLRRLAEQKVAYISEGWRVYEPDGKSGKVMGGIGTFRLPPSADGTRLATLTDSCNASAGVPALISPDVWDKIGLAGGQEGQRLDGRGCWRPMTEGWAARYKSTRDIARGYLVVSDPDSIHLRGERAPTQIHPFTVMEYYSGSKELFDYVYATGDTAYSRYRQRIEQFFESYKDREERYGRYLLAGDMVDALWDAQYDSPAALRAGDTSADSQLQLLQARVREHNLGDNVIEELLEALGIACRNDADLLRISRDAGIPHSAWQGGGMLAEKASRLVHVAVQREKILELVEVVALENPEIIS